ncbi:DEAD/DEAH box helicase [Lentimicrobium saccharophilum]|uniref:DNA 3'-5' helicase n=1 Tax=Lentimicrobium saccharophilum TaxID=1678841 RepID=A0A0S7C3M8_9BACT|nr:DEAD/DEAH box helicase [Lentimicrobium saccharophilum]GAP44022.1 DEAD/DEAH box helicase [Lentimicrobium saccharophilum]
MNPQALLKKYFGYDHFRLNQEEVIISASARKDTLIIMPTGGGKSVCYQITALMKEGVYILVYPLIALMKDQLDGSPNNKTPGNKYRASLKSYAGGFYPFSTPSSLPTLVKAAIHLSRCSRLWAAEI